MSTFSLEEEAVFGAGSFWEAEDVFARLHGVTSTDVGYAGGTTGHPTFHDMGDHVEAVRVYFDQRAISYEELLATFWKIHDPFSDMEPRYSSRIFYASNEQKKVAKESIHEKQTESEEPLKTSLEALHRFWPAEEYHQHYLAKMRGEL